MRQAILILIVLGLAHGGMAADLGKAHSLLMRGRYAEAEDLYRPDAGRSADAALGLAAALEATGKPAEAVKTLLPLAEKNANVQAELARLAIERGDLDEARLRVDAALALSHEHVQARYLKAELARLGGRYDEAERGYHGLVDFYNNTDVTQPDKLRAIGLAAAHYARWNHLNDQFDFLVNELYPQARKSDENYWPARYEAGMLFAEKFNRADALREFQAALEINPRAAEVLTALAGLATEAHKADEAAHLLERALEADPALVDAWLLKADIAWSGLQTAAALDILEHKALPLCPIREETLARIAACYLLLDDNLSPPADSRFGRLLAEVLRRNPHPVEFYDTLAEMLEGRYKLAEAERYFRAAHEALPRYVGPLAELGLLMMRMGREDEAKKLLDEAFEADPFHVRVKNMLEVLDVLSSMRVLETEHFVIKYDAGSRRMAERMAPQLEAIHRELRDEFRYQPPGKTPVEIFASCRGQDGHGWFSARVIGLPMLDTVAASTGRIVAMVSPEESYRAFNWHRVLKHEMTHVFNLQQSQHNIPHWFAEGVAVSGEAGNRPFSWNVLLHRRAQQGKLFTLADIDTGFTRPMSGDDCQLAYCQGELYVQYMKSRGGSEAIRKMLAAYTESPETPKAIRAVFGVTVEEFEHGYGEFVKRRLQAAPVLAEPAEEEVAPMEKLCRDRPKDAALAARLAYAYITRNDQADALRMVRTALKLDPHQPLAAALLVRMHKAGGDAESIKLLDLALDRQAPHPFVLAMLASLQLKAKHYDEAAKLFQLGQRCEPGNPKWTAGLARVYLTSDNAKLLAETLTALAQAEPDELASRKKLAEAAFAKRDTAAARRWAEEALEIKTNDAEAHRLLAAALVEQAEFVPAIAEYEAAVEYNPKHLQQRMALADACVQAGQNEKAQAVLKELLKLDKNYPGAAVLLESLSRKP